MAHSQAVVSSAHARLTAAFTAHVMPWWQFILPALALVYVASLTLGR